MPTVTPLGRLKICGRERNRTSRRRGRLLRFERSSSSVRTPTSSEIGGGGGAHPASRWRGGPARRRPLGSHGRGGRLACFGYPLQVLIGGRREARTPTSLRSTGLANRRDEPIFACLPLAMRCDLPHGTSRWYAAGTGSRCCPWRARSASALQAAGFAGSHQPVSLGDGLAPP